MNNLHKQYICENCLQLLVNGESNHSEDELHTFNVKLNNWKQQYYVAVGLTENNEPSFSWKSCDICETKAGNRYEFIFKKEKIKLVVVDEHTLGYIYPNDNKVAILHTSILKGSPYSDRSTIYISNHKNIRLASEKDFDDFRCMFDGYKQNSEDYEYQSTELPELIPMEKTNVHINIDKSIIYKSEDSLKCED